MFYVGLDIHSKHISVCVLNEAGKFLHRTRVRASARRLRTCPQYAVSREGVGSFYVRLRCTTWPRGSVELCQSVRLMAL